MRGSALVRAWAFIQENTGTQGLLNELELRGFVFTVQGANFRCWLTFLFTQSRISFIPFTNISFSFRYQWKNMTNMNGQSEAMPWKVLYFNIFIYLFLPKVYADMFYWFFIFRGPSTNTCTLASGRNWPRRHVSKYKMWRGEVEVIHHLVHIVRFHWKDIGTVGRIWTWGF